MKLLHCANIGCHCCKEAIRIGKTLLGAEKYICKCNQKKHKSINAFDCINFNCYMSGEYSICESCRGKK